MSRLSTEQLFQGFRRRADVAALGEVFDRTAEDLFKIALYLGPEAGDAEDLVQATYLTAIEAADNYDAQRPLLPWLIGILSNHAHKARSQFHRRRSRSGQMPTSLPVTDGEDDPERQAEQAELHAALTDTIARLPQPYRQVLTLHFEHGMTARKIGEVLERPAGTVRSQVVRGLEHLRRLLPVGLSGAAIVLAPGHVLAGVRAEVLRCAEESVVALGAGSAWHGAWSLIGASVAGLAFAGISWGLIAGDGIATPIEHWTESLARDLPAGASTRAAQTAPGPQRRVELHATGTSGPIGVIDQLVVELTISGQPASAGVLVELLPRTETHDLIHIQQMMESRRFGHSDDEGKVVFSAVPVGNARVMLAGSLIHNIEFVVGEAIEGGGQTVELAIPPLRQVSGRVVTPSGMAAERSRVWLSTTGNEEAVGAVALVTGATGEFQVMVPEGKVFLWADRRGLGPSRITRVDERDAVALHLTAVKSQLRCAVAAQDGRGLPDVIVQLMPVQSGAESFAPVFGLSDGSGVVRLDRLPPGPAMLVARKPGFATVTQRIELPRGGSVTDLTLPRGARIEGTVRREDGEPWPGVSLLAEVADGGVGAHDAKLRRVIAVSDERGRFALRDLPLGLVRVRAVAKSCSAWIDSGRFDLRAGQIVSWDPTDAHQAQIRGRVQSVQGTPIAGCVVVATPVGGARLVNRYRRRHGMTSADGTFRLRPMERGVQYHVAAFTKAERIREVEARAIAPRCKPGVVDTILTFDPDNRIAEQGLSGALYDTSGNTVATANVLIRRIPLPSWERYALRGGTFQIDLPPGRYEVGFDVAKYGVYFLPMVDVARGERRRLAPHLPVLGTIDLSVQVGDGSNGTGNRLDTPANIEIVDRCGRRMHAGLVDGALRNHLAPGSYVAVLNQAGAALQRRSFEIGSGKVSHVVLAARPGRSCHLRFVFDPLDNTFDGPGQLHVILRAKRDQSVISDTYVPAHGVAVFDWPVALDPGRYSVTATSVWGGSCEQKFDVGAKPITRTFDLEMPR